MSNFVQLVRSGGQYGVDQAALAVAKQFKILTTGCMPKGFLTKEGPKPEFRELFNCYESNSPLYPPRTFDNVREADATVRIAHNLSSPEELCTLRAIRQYNKPFFDIDLNDDADPQQLAHWIWRGNYRHLNIAGNATQLAGQEAVKILVTVFDILQGE